MCTKLRETTGVDRKTTTRWQRGIALASVYDRCNNCKTSLHWPRAVARSGIHGEDGVIHYVTTAPPPGQAQDLPLLYYGCCPLFVYSRGRSCACPGVGVVMGWGGRHDSALNGLSPLRREHLGRA